MSEKFKYICLREDVFEKMKKYGRYRDTYSDVVLNLMKKADQSDSFNIKGCLEQQTGKSQTPTATPNYPDTKEGNRT
ncbi:MAG: hypothetical protein R3321_15150 [Nitrososphaeraceae archaeon]|nr:hypothetical protein [Nitrososphaeraceae archaeon]